MRARDPGLPQHRAFFDIAHRQPARAFARSAARDLDGAVPIGIGLHHRHHFHAGPDDALAPRENSRAIWPSEISTQERKLRIAISFVLASPATVSHTHP